MINIFSKFLLLLILGLFLTINFTSSVLADSSSNSAIKYDSSGNRHGVTSTAWIQRTFAGVSPSFTSSGNYYFNRYLTNADEITCSTSAVAYGTVWGVTIAGGGSTISRAWTRSSWCGHSGNITFWGFPAAIGVSNTANSYFRGISVAAGTTVMRWF